MVTVVFGLGKFFKNHRTDIERYIIGDKVIFADNNADLIGLFEGKKVYNAKELIELEFDSILITSIYESEIKNN